MGPTCGGPHWRVTPYILSMTVKEATLVFLVKDGTQVWDGHNKWLSALENGTNKVACLLSAVLMGTCSCGAVFGTRPTRGGAS